MNINKSIHEQNYVIISADKSEFSKQQNAGLQSRLLEDLINLIGYDTSMTMASGRYNGIEEESYAVILPGDPSSKLWYKIVNGLIDLGIKYKQEYLLWVRNDIDVPMALFNKMDGLSETEYLWIETDAGIKDTNQPYTFIQDKYFLTEIIEEPIRSNTACIAMLDDLAWVFDAPLVIYTPKECSGDCQTGIECPDCDQKITWH